MIQTRFLSLVVMSIFTCAAFAQEGPDATTRAEDIVLGTSSPDLLLRRGDVRDDLQLSSEQSIKVFTIQDSVDDQAQAQAQAPVADKPATDDQTPDDNSYESLRKYAAMQFDQVLTPDQMKRLKQISLQLTGLSALAWDDVQKQLDLPRDLQIKIADLCAQEHEANASVLLKGQSGDLLPDQVTAKIKKNHQVLNDELAKVVPDSIKDRFKALWGRAFKPTATP